MSDTQSKLMPALYGGIVIGILSGVPGLNLINCCCCAGVILGGFLSVLFYTREPNAPAITSGDALALGALAGVFGAFIGTALTAVMLGTVGGVILEFLRELLDRFGHEIPPDMLEGFEEAIGESLSLTPVAIIVTFAKFIIIGPLFGLLGGLIGYAVFKPKPQTLAPPPGTNPPTPL
jgi:hypothetical protein